MLTRAVVDTNVLISGTISNNKNSPTVKIVDEIFDGNISCIYNVKIIKEYVDVLYREKFDIDENDITDLIIAISRYGIEVSYQDSDLEFGGESDKKFYDAYSMIKDAYLITGNLKHFPKEKNIISPREFLDIKNKIS